MSVAVKNNTVRSAKFAEAKRFFAVKLLRLARAVYRSAGESAFGSSTNMLVVRSAVMLSVSSLGKAPQRGYHVDDGT